MKVIGTKLDNSEYDPFEFYCNENGLTKSEQLRQLVKNFLDSTQDKQDLEQKEKPKAIVTLTADKPNKSIDSLSIPKMKNIRISYDDGKTWYNVS